MLQQRLAPGALAVLAALLLLRLMRHAIPGWVAPEPAHAKPWAVHLPVGVDQGWRNVERAMTLGGLCAVAHIGVGSERRVLFARVGAWRWLPGLGYAGALLLLGAALAGLRWGGVGPRQEYALGESHPLGAESRVTAKVDRIAFLPRADGNGMQFYESILLLQRAGAAEVARRVVLGQGAHLDGVAIYQDGYGPAARVSAWGAEGATLTVRPILGEANASPVARVRFSGREQEHLLAIPGTGLVVRLIYYARSELAGAVGPALLAQVQRSSNAQVLAERFVGGSGDLAAEGVQVRVALESFVVLHAEREPELPLVVLAGALMVVGLVAAMLAPSREAHVLLRPDPAGTLCLIAPQEGEARWLRPIGALLCAEAGAEALPENDTAPGGAGLGALAALLLLAQTVAWVAQAWGAQRAWGAFWSADPLECWRLAAWAGSAACWLAVARRGWRGWGAWVGWGAALVGALLAWAGGVPLAQWLRIATLYAGL
jgi:hypothetical protein